MSPGMYRRRGSLAAVLTAAAVSVLALVPVAYPAVAADAKVVPGRDIPGQGLLLHDSLADCDPPLVSLPGNDRPCPEVLGTWSNPVNEPDDNPWTVDDDLTDLVPVSGDLVVAVGWTVVDEDDSATGNDIVLVGFDPESGSILWESRYRTIGPDFPAEAILSTDGDAILVAGASSAQILPRSGDPFLGFPPLGQFPIGGSPVVLAFDPADGSLLWTHLLDVGGAGTAHGIAVTPRGPTPADGPIAFVTSTVDASGPDGYETDVVTTAFRLSDRQTLWQVSHDDPDHAGNEASIDRHDLAREVLVSPSGDQVYVAAESSRAGQTGRDFLALAYDADDGALVWRARYPSPLGFEKATIRDAAVSSDGGTVVITGDLETYLPTTGGYQNRDFATVAIDAPTGQIRWARSYRGASNAGMNIPFDLLVHDGRAYVAGAASGGPPVGLPGDDPTEQNYNATVVTYSLATGTDALPPIQLDRPGRIWEAATALAISSSGEELYVSGFSQTVPGRTRLGLHTSVGWAGPVAVQPHVYALTRAIATATGSVRWTSEFNAGSAPRLEAVFPRVAELSPDGRTLFVGATFARGHNPEWSPTGDGWNFSEIGMIGYELGTGA